MKKYFIVLFIIFSLSANAQIIPKDKQLHLYCGGAIGSISYNIVPNHKYIYGITGATLAGIAKESYDKINGNKFDCKDLGFTILGGVIIVSINHLIIKKIKKSRHKKSGFYF